MNLNLLSNQELLTQLGALRLNERTIQAEFLRFLAEVDTRRLYANEGYPSLFGYVTKVLRYSEASALKRIQIARMGLRHPELLVALELGKLSLTVLSKLCPHLDSDNVKELLMRVEGLSVRAVEKCLAPESSVEPRDEIHRLSKRACRIHFTASEAFIDKLQNAKDLLRAKYPKAKIEDILSDALDLLIDAKTPKTLAKRISRHAAQHSKHIPIAIQAEVWEHYRGKCSFVSHSGHVCSARAFLEYDHILPWALGGSSHDSGNIRLLCRTHNRLVAEDVFGKKFVEQKITNTDELSMNRFMHMLWEAGGWQGAKEATRKPQP